MIILLSIESSQSFVIAIPLIGGDAFMFHRRCPRRQDRAAWHHHHHASDGAQGYTRRALSTAEESVWIRSTALKVRKEDVRPDRLMPRKFAI
jgi:hypothetical protein